MIISLESVLGRHDTWHFALIAPTIIIPLTILFIYNAPDSPRALIMSGKREEAERSLMFYQVFFLIILS